MATVTSNATGGGLWSAGATWAGGSAPADGDSVVIAAGDTVTIDTDMSALVGFLNVTVTGGATPGLLRFKYDAAGTYVLPIRTAGKLAGTLSTNNGRLLANSDGVWETLTPLPVDRLAVVDLRGTAYIDAAALDISLIGTEPTHKSVTVYGTKLAVTSVSAATDTLTCASAHGWATDTLVMVRSTGALPAPLVAARVYYVSAPSGADLKLAASAAGAVIDITDAGSGTIEVYSGHTNTATAIVNVLEDVSAEAQWQTAAGMNSVVLVDAAAPADYDQQRLTLSGIAAGQLTLSANVDSAQYPGAMVVLASRNVAIRSGCTTSVSIVSGGVGARLACEIRSTAGTGTTFYGSGVISGSGHTVSGTVSGCGYGVNYGSGHTVSGTVSGCGSGVISGSVVLTSTAVLAGNGRDIYNAIVSGRGASLGSVVQNGAYKYTTLPMTEQRFSCGIFDLAGVAGAIGFWTQGGYTKSAAYAVGTHGTPPVASTLIHETTLEDSNRMNYVEFPVWGQAGVEMAVTLYAKLAATGSIVTLPSVGIYDPGKEWLSVDETLIAGSMLSNTDWQTVIVACTPATSGELRVRVQVKGGNTSGTGTDKLYWFLDTTGVALEAMYVGPVFVLS